MFRNRKIICKPVLKELLWIHCIFLSFQSAADFTKSPKSKIDGKCRNFKEKFIMTS